MWHGAGVEETRDNGDYSSPWRNPALAVELTLREREALMTEDDWSAEVDRILARTETSDG